MADLTPFNPDSWMDVFALGMLGMISLVGAIAPILINNNRKNAKTLGDIKEQVANSHDTNLRDDITELARAVREGFSETKKDISGLREEMRTERLERIEGDRLHVVYNVAGG